MKTPQGQIRVSQERATAPLECPLPWSEDSCLLETGAAPGDTPQHDGEAPIHRAHAVSGRKTPGAKPEEPIAVILAKSLRAKWRNHCREWARCAKHCSEDSVHELRVATRRLMAHLALIQALVPGKPVPRLRRALKQRLSSLGDVRDIHVQRIAVERLSKRFEGLDAWHKFLKKREKKLVAKAGKKVATWKKKKLEKLLEDIHAAIRTHTGSNAAQRELLDGAVQASFDEACARWRAIRADQPQTIHRLRVAFKGFRYRLEAISPDMTGLSRKDLLPLGRYQRQMGNIQDLEVMKQGLLSFLEHHPMRASLLKSFNEHLDKQRRRAINRFVKSAGALLNFWPLPHRPTKKERIYENS